MLKITSYEEFPIEESLGLWNELSTDLSFSIKLALIFQNTFPGTQSFAGKFDFSDQSYIICPFVNINSKVKNIASLPYNWDAGIIISNTNSIGEKLSLISKKLTTQVWSLSICGISLDGVNLHQSISRQKNFNCTEVKSYYTRFKGRSFNDIFENDFSSKTRNQCRKALKSGLEIRRNASDQLINEYYSLYVENTKKWGSNYSSYPKSFFESLIAQDKVDFWTASKDNTFIGGIVIIKYEKWVYYWAGVTNKEYSNLCANNGLLYTAMAAYCEEDFDLFDFGPSTGLGTVDKFKKGYGPLERNHHYVQYESNMFQYILSPITKLKKIIIK